MILELAIFAQLAVTCAPRVAVETLAAVAKTESGFETLAINDNTAHRAIKPASKEDAIAMVSDLLVQRHSVDLGLMQINSANLAALGLTVAAAFDPCRSLAAAQSMLLGGYTAPGEGQDTQPALHQALSRYNTGDAARGISNGYVARVRSAAEIVVPAIRLQGEAAPTPAFLSAGTMPVLAQPLPPSWDVYGQARAAQAQGARVYGAPRMTASSSRAPEPAVLPQPSQQASAR